jgi:hypothetical protein
MPKHLLHTLRGQILLLTGLCAACIITAVVMASQRAVFEQHIAERYQPLPVELQPLAESLARGSLEQAQFTVLSMAQRLALYHTWMAHIESPPAETPRLLVSIAPELYLARAERSIVTGRMQQKQRAVIFLALTGSPDALPILQKANRWAARRQMPELASHIASAIAQLKGIQKE